MGADDFQEICAGDDLLFCVCQDFDGSDCPNQLGTWVKQGILCTCEEWFANSCPVE